MTIKYRHRKYTEYNRHNSYHSRYPDSTRYNSEARRDRRNRRDSSLKDLAQEIVHIINKQHGSIINSDLCRRFIRQYMRMCRHIGSKAVNPKIIYHWTNSANFDSIIQNGLKVPDGDRIKPKTDIGSMAEAFIPHQMRICDDLWRYNQSICVFSFTWKTI